MFDGNKSLSARLSNPATPPKMNMSLAERALREANGEGGLSIKGAGSRGNVVEVSGLADGTTSDDVEVRLSARILRTLIDVLPPGHLQALWPYYGPRGHEEESGHCAPYLQI